MKIIQHAVRYPVTTAVGVILLVLFGMIALFGLPVQLETSTALPPPDFASRHFPDMTEVMVLFPVLLALLISFSI